MQSQPQQPVSKQSVQVFGRKVNIKFIGECLSKATLVLLRSDESAYSIYSVDQEVGLLKRCFVLENCNSRRLL